MRSSNITTQFVAGWLPLLLFFLATGMLYGPFLNNPAVFDDLYYFDGSIHSDAAGSFFDFNLRWLPYATFEWTLNYFGQQLEPLRLGNLALHAANCSLLFIFLRRFYTIVLPADKPLPAQQQAFASALIFGLHPAAVYAVAYLIQRSILLATFFSLLTFCLFLHGIRHRHQRWLLASAATYLLAGFSKEHAIMVPAVIAALLLLVEKPTRQLAVRVGPTFLLYGLAALVIAWSANLGRYAARAYEPNALPYLVLEHIDPAWAYPLSVVTQASLYFKYLWLWIVPNPAWMSVDMIENFTARLGTWPIVGLLAFTAYPIIAVRFVLRRGSIGALGFAMLWPWLLFATELATVRIQETFVLYRSYLWMTGAFAAMPYLLQKLSGRQAVLLLTLWAALYVPATWNRLQSFSEPLRLWQDAARLVENRQDNPRIGRIYHNRGVAYLDLKRYAEALRDFDTAAKFLPRHSFIYNDRGVVYLETGNYAQALRNFSRAIELKPDYHNPWLGRAMTYEALGDRSAARLDYSRSCQLGVAEACRKF